MVKKLTKKKSDIDQDTLLRLKNALSRASERLSEGKHGEPGLYGMELGTKRAFGAALRPYLLNTELGTYDREILVDLCREILEDANQKIQNLASEIVASTIRRLYPNL